MRNKLVLPLGLIIASITYAVWQNLSGQQAIVVQTPGQSYKAANDALLQTLSQLNNSAPVSGSPTINSSGPQTMMGGGSMMHRYIDGSYTGIPADAYYGTVQVKAVVQNGKLVDVTFLQHPSDRSTSRAINNQAMPMLTQEAIVAQSAQVDGVSGATFTSQAFQQSLASALVLAKN